MLPPTRYNTSNGEGERPNPLAQSDKRARFFGVASRRPAPSGAVTSSSKQQTKQEDPEHDDENISAPVVYTADLSGRRTLVTGAGRGIGLAIARRLVAGGARVAIADVDENGARAAAQDLGNGTIALRCDVRSSADVAAAVAAAVAEFGGLDGLVNNAGVEIAKPITELSEEEFSNLFDINVTGTFRCTKAAIPAIAAAGGGAIVNLGSSPAPPVGRC